MQPSSLIFVVIVGIWAAFFVQYWVRRREHIATARSVDAFTSTMRVLEVRDRQPTVEVSERPRSYAVSPVRPVRPQVTVKRADAMLTVRDVMARGVSAPVSSQGRAAGSAQWDDGDDHGHGHGHGGHDHGHGERVSDGRVSGEGGVMGRVLGLVSGIRRAPRAIRGLTLLLGVAGVLVYAVLSVVGLLVPWAFVAPLTLAVAGFAWLRADVRAGRASARTGMGATADPRRIAGAGRGVASRGDNSVVGEALADVVAGSPEPLVDRRDVVFDLTDSGPAPMVEVPAAAARSSRALLVDDDDIPLTWDPVPVPRPTYTMKAKATRVAAPAPSPEALAQKVPAHKAPVNAAVKPTRSGSTGRPRVMDVVDDSWDDDVPRAFPTRRVVGA